MMEPLLSMDHQNNRNNVPLVPQRTIRPRKSKNKKAAAAKKKLNRTKATPTPSNNMKHILTAKLHTRHYVQHNYHDHAQDDLEDVQHKLQKPPKGTKEPFPMKLHKMLTFVDDNSCSSNSFLKDVVSWMPHGRSFCVHKPADFVEKIMPMFFKQTKWTSFQRQLNLYGFQRLTRGLDAGTYYHEMFLRGQCRYFLCHCIVRQKVKGTGIKAASNPETEPDFYKMPFVDRSVDVDTDKNVTVLHADDSDAGKINIVTKKEPKSMGDDYSASVATATATAASQSFQFQFQSRSSAIASLDLRYQQHRQQQQQAEEEDRNRDRTFNIAKSVAAAVAQETVNVPVPVPVPVCDYWTAFAIALSGDGNTNGQGNCSGDAGTVVSASEVSASDVDEDFELSVSERFDPLLELDYTVGVSTTSAATATAPALPVHHYPVNVDVNTNAVTALDIYSSFPRV
mmetsp:Transcript_27296/g.42405  ORF Transcript_27296/g.42405 Transcript_27296/m.42405 type:complete len:453 (+) Transcript_27296:151-1509(+)